MADTKRKDERSLEEILENVKRMTIQGDEGLGHAITGLSEDDEKLKCIRVNYESIHRNLDHAEQIIDGIGFRGFLKKAIPGAAPVAAQSSASQRAAMHGKWMWSRTLVPRLSTSSGQPSVNPLRWSWQMDLDALIIKLDSYKAAHPEEPVIIMYSGERDMDREYRNIDEAVDKIKAVMGAAELLTREDARLDSSGTQSGIGLAHGAPASARDQTAAPIYLDTKADRLLQDISRGQDRILEKADVIHATVERQIKEIEGISEEQQSAQGRMNKNLAAVRQMNGRGSAPKPR